MVIDLMEQDSFHLVMEKKDILILGQGPTQGLHQNTSLFRKYFKRLFSR